MRPLPRPARPRRRRPARLALLAAALGPAVAAGCELPSFGAPRPKSEQGEDVYGLWQGFFLTSIPIALLVYGLIIFCLVRYRRRRPEGDEDEEPIPDQRAYHIPLEIFYTATPVVIVAVLFAASWVVEARVTDVAPDTTGGEAAGAEAPVNVEVVGFQWSWQFTYPEEGITVTGDAGEPPEMVLPLGHTARLELVSFDVNHAFWVPDFLSKRDLIPGVDNEIEVTPTEAGTYTGRCAEYCGLDHWAMYFSVRVVEPDDYEAWLDEQQAEEGA